MGDTGRYMFERDDLNIKFADGDEENNTSIGRNPSEVSYLPIQSVSYGQIVQPCKMHRNAVEYPQRRRCNGRHLLSERIAEYASPGV